MEIWPWKSLSAASNHCKNINKANTLINYICWSTSEKCIKYSCTISFSRFRLIHLDMYEVWLHSKTMTSSLASNSTTTTTWLNAIRRSAWKNYSKHTNIWWGEEKHHTGTNVTKNRDNSPWKSSLWLWDFTTPLDLPLLPVTGGGLWPRPNRDYIREVRDKSDWKITETYVVCMEIVFLTEPSLELREQKTELQ